MAHNEITRQAAKSLESKLLSSVQPLAVFVTYGGWSATKVTTDTFKNQIRLNPEKLMGVYTADVGIDQLMDDFSTAGVK